MGPFKSVSDKLNLSLEDEMTIIGYQSSRGRLLLVALLVLLTGGLFLLLLTWRKDIRLEMTHKRCQPHFAQKVLLKDRYNQYYEEEVHRDGPENDPEKEDIYFNNKEVKYVWNSSIKEFSRLKALDEGKSMSDLHLYSSGLGHSIFSQEQKRYGENFIKVSVIPVLTLIFQEAVNPFYVFQVYAIILWSIQMYYNFAIIIAVLSSVSIGSSVWETRKQSRALRETVKSQSQVRVLRDNQEQSLSSRELVPGDVLLLPPRGQCSLECDAVLLQGSCTVNEAMLTGESLPVTKVAFPADSQAFDYNQHKRHILFCGTELLQSRVTEGNYIKAVVIRTGFMTMKGELVRSILYPKPLDLQFYSDFMKCVGVFLLLGLVGMAYSFWIWTSNGGTVQEILVNSLDLWTFVVPPSLPAALTAINGFAQKRLKKEEIFCLSSKYISLCGGIDLFCFDKTGTLTEGSLDFAGVVPVQDSAFKASIEEPSLLPCDDPLVISMASCHSLFLLDDQVLGSPPDLKLFQAVDWNLKEFDGPNADYGGLTTPVLLRPKNADGSSEFEVAILRVFPFESEEQRMTVLTMRRDSSDHALCDVYIKGAPEKIASLCDPATVPLSFPSVLQWYARQGLRLLAMAWKPSQPVTGERDEVEAGATFLGLVLLQNQVKPETQHILRELHDADILTVMVTGDNLLTALSVARVAGLLRPEERAVVVEASMVSSSLRAVQHLQLVFYDPEENRNSIITKAPLQSVAGSNYVFAIDGPSFALLKTYDPINYKRILHRGRVFARMLPDQKIQLVEALQGLGHQVGMCGDGCNDCGALKAAHAGISLSMAEASVAAPFTSRRPNIDCVAKLLREGRATLVSVLVSFKYGVAYCFTQFMSVLLLFYISTEPHDNQYLIIDFVLAALPLVVMGNVGVHPYLVKRRPTRHILTFIPLFSVISFIILQTIIYVMVWFYCKEQPWFKPFQYIPGQPPNPSYEQTSIFLANIYSYVIAAVIFSKAAPYRKSIFTNYLFVGWLVMAVALLLATTLIREKWLTNILHLLPAPEQGYHLVLLALGITNFAFCLIWETWVVDHLLDKILLPGLRCLRGPRHPYQKMEQELRNMEGWPPLSPEPSTCEVGTEDNPLDEDSSRQVLTNSLVMGNGQEESEYATPAAVSSSAQRRSRERNSVKDQLMSFATFRGSKKKKQNNPHISLPMEDFPPPPPPLSPPPPPPPPPLPLDANDVNDDASPYAWTALHTNDQGNGSVC